jgi:uncharacterized protein YlaI
MSRYEELDEEEERPRKIKKPKVKQYWCENCDASLSHKKEKCPECGHKNK